MRINRCSVMGKRGFQFNDGVCHIGFGAREKAEQDAAESGEGVVSFDLDGTLIDAEGNPNAKMIDELNRLHESGFQIAVTTARATQSKPAVEKILSEIGVSDKVQAIHLTDSKSKGLYFRDAGFSPVFHIDDKAVEIAGMPDSVRGILASDIVNSSTNA